MHHKIKLNKLKIKIKKMKKVIIQVHPVYNHIKTAKKQTKYK